MNPVTDIPLDLIDADPDQPRKYFDEAKLQELAVTIKEHGVQSPAKVYPNPDKPGRFILEVGERRLRASEIAGVPTLPCLVEEPKEPGLRLELQLIENSQREGIGPLEEGEAYLKLKKEHGHTIETLMERTGKGRSHVYARMKLTELVPAAKKALQEGKLQPAIAELAGTIGDAKLQDQFVKECLGSNGKSIDSKVLDDLEDHGIRFELINDEDVSRANDLTDSQPLSFRAAKALLRRKYSTRLALAKFQPSDETLTPAGACGPCPHRSGNQPELPGMTNGKAAEDMCTKTSCFEEKTAAAWKKVAAGAKARGLDVLSSKEAKAERVFDHDGMEVAIASPYVELDTKVPANLAKPGANTTFGKLLGKKAAEIPRVLVQDESGAPREMIDRAAAVKLLRAEGKLDKPEKPKKAKVPNEHSVRDKDRELRQAALFRVLDQLAQPNKAGDDTAEYKKNLAWMRWMGRAIARSLGFGGGDASAVFLEHVGCETWDAYEEKIFMAKTLGEVRALVVQILVTENANGKLFGWVGRDHHDLFDDAMKLFGIDWDKAMAAAKEAAKLEEKVEAAKKKGATDDGKRCGLVHGKNGDHCILDLGHDGAHSTGKLTWSERKKKGAKKP